MTEEEKQKEELLKQLAQVTPDQLRKVNKDVDHFIQTFGGSIYEHAEQHKLEYDLLDKTILLCCTDAICIKRADEHDGNILAGLTCIGDREHLVMLYKALGEKLKEKGILNDEEP